MKYLDRYRMNRMLSRADAKLRLGRKDGLSKTKSAIRALRVVLKN